MDPEEFEMHVRPVALKAKQTALDNGAWFSYQDDQCTKPDMFIHEFKDGHKELVQLGREAGEYKVLKAF